MEHAQLPISSLPVWQALNSIDFSNVRIAETPGKGSGLVVVGGSLQPTASVPPASAESSHGVSPTVPLISVPQGLVLHAEAVEEYAKQDRNYRELFDTAGQRLPRQDVLLFLLVQLAVAMRKPGEDPVALPTPWAEYIKFLPHDVPVPTLWTDSERLLLQGTSLEAAVEAKMIALEYEFDDIHDQASNIPYWQSALWEREFSLQKDHWFLVDAWYRSRCLELPRFGPSMVPCIDMVNHSANPNAYYDDSSVIADSAMSGVVLLPRPGHPLAASDEITISYTGHGGGGTAARLEYTNGDDSDVHGVKSASEMLFSYGFVDPQSARHSLVLPFRPFPDDPLAKAKLHVFGGPTPRLEIERLRSATSTDGGDESDENSVLGADNGSSVDSDAAATKIPAAREARVRWSCPFSYLMCVNEEDGIDFRLRQETDGSTQLRMFWQNEDATEQARDFAALTQKHPLASVFQLRVVTVLQEAIESHLERMQAAGGQQESSEARGPEHDDTEMAEDAAGASAQDHPDSSSDEDSNVRSFVARQAGLLRDIESRVLSSALEALEAERADLLSNATVVTYLGSMELAENELAHEQTTNQAKDDEPMEGNDEDDDFS